MDRSESEDILKSLYPIGKERWIKVRYSDFEWCVRHLSLNPNNTNQELGFEVTALGVRDEYTPQISALMDLRDDITSAFANYPDESVLNNIRMMISCKIQELKERSIMERGASGSDFA